MNDKLGPALEVDLGSTNTFAPKSSRAARVDEAYMDYFRRTQNGEVLDPEVFCDQHPSIRSSLQNLFDFEDHLQANPHLLQEPPCEWPAVDTMFLDYHLRCELGRGGFSRVYLATQGSVGNRLVAVKIVRHAGTEANMLGPISHANIVPVYSVEHDKKTGLSLVCMPFAGTATLGAVIDQVRKHGRPGQARLILEATRDPRVQVAQPKPASPVFAEGSFIDGVRWIGAAIADGLAHVHDLAICHRDLKPSNILLSPSGTPMLLDFNLAAHMREKQAPIGGTLPYMAPEQLRLLGPGGAATETPDARGDIFALGVILYELATGKHPFGPIPVKLDPQVFCKTLLQRQTAGAVPAYEVNPDVDRALSDLIQRCLALDPTIRPESAAHIAAALRSGMTRPRTSSARWTLRRILAASLVALACATPLVIGTRQATGEPPPLTTATELCRKGRFEDAVPLLTTALVGDPKNDKILTARARAYLQLEAKDFMRAREDFEKANAIAPRGYFDAGIAYTFDLETQADPKARKYASSEVHYVDAIKHNYATPEVYNNLAYAHRKQNSNNAIKAKKWVDEAIKGNPQLQAAYCNRIAITHSLFLRDMPRVVTRLTNPAAAAKFKPLPEEVKTPAELLARAQSALDDIQQALKVGPVSADLHMEAARIYANGSFFDKSWVARMFDELELARDHGYDLSRNTDGMFNPFRDDPRFQRIAEKAPAHVYVPASYTVNPVPWNAD